MIAINICQLKKSSKLFLYFIYWSPELLLLLRAVGKITKEVAKLVNSSRLSQNLYYKVTLMFFSFYVFLNLLFQNSEPSLCKLEVTMIIVKIFVNPIQMGFLGAGHGWGEKGSPSLKSVTHILHWWNLAQLYPTWHTFWVLQTSAFFHWKWVNFALSRNTDIDCILIHNF